MKVVDLQKHFDAFEQQQLVIAFCKQRRMAFLLLPPHHDCPLNLALILVYYQLLTFLADFDDALNHLALFVLL